MATPDQKKTESSIALDSFNKMVTFVEKNKFPLNLSQEKYQEAEKEFASLSKIIGEEDANYDIYLNYCPNVKRTLSCFTPIDTPDGDKRKRKKKVSLRIVADSSTKYVAISPALHELLNAPSHVSFQVKDNVLAIGCGLPASTDYKLYVEHHGYVVKSASLVDFLCDYFNLLEYDGSMSLSTTNAFKTSFSDYKDLTLRLNGDLTTVVFMYIH